MTDKIIKQENKKQNKKNKKKIIKNVEVVEKKIELLYDENLEFKKLYIKKRILKTKHDNVLNNKYKNQLVKYNDLYTDNLDLMIL
jgi:hypothetical protein